MINFEAFTTVKEHLLKQMNRSVNWDNSCMYRGDNGLKCAIGILMPDEEYYDGMENVSVSDLMDLDCLNGLDEGMLLKLQYLHDFIDESSWKREFDELEVKFKEDGTFDEV